jgi:hypothetical protein
MAFIYSRAASWKQEAARGASVSLNGEVGRHVGSEIAIAQDRLCHRSPAGPMPSRLGKIDRWQGKRLGRKPMGPAEGIERHICQLRFGRSTIELHRPKVSYAMRWPCELQPKSLTRLGISRAPDVPARCPACADLLPSRGSTKLSKVG